MRDSLFVSFNSAKAYCMTIATGFKHHGHIIIIEFQSDIY